MEWNFHGRAWSAALAAAWLLLAGTPAGARDIAGRVTHVGDGDSLWLQPAMAGAPIEVRLVGIDAPELCQRWGREAREALAAAVLGRPVVLRTVGIDRYGRTLGVVEVGRANVNARLVEQGHAWAGRWHGRPRAYAAEEQHARQARLGLHADGEAAVEPRAFRQQHGPCGPARSGRGRPWQGRSPAESAQNR